MKLVGLTGGLGTGKSTVSDMLRAQGLDVIDADELAREVVKPGSFGLRALVRIFGDDILKDGSLDRSKLAEKIFSDDKARAVLERVTHPLIQWRAKRELQFLRDQNKAIAIYDAALLFEKDLVKQFDHIVVVYAPEKTQLERVGARDKITEEAIRARLNSQWPIDKKKESAHTVIDNSGTRDETKKQVMELIRKLRE